MMWLILCLVTFFTACDRGKNEPSIQKAPSERLAEKQKLYCSLSAAEAERTSCDGLLFTSLRGIGCDGISISNFESSVEPGQYFRSESKDCFVPDSVSNRSDSTISKDMLIGAMIKMWHDKDLNAIRRMIDFGKSRSWVMGQAKDDVTLASKCLMSPTLISMLYDIESKLSGKLFEPSSSDSVTGLNNGFRAHLDILFILLDLGVHGFISNSSLATLKGQAERQPQNALFQAAYSLFTGDQSLAISLLELQFPEKSLPNNRDNHCEPYLYQRDTDNSDWVPCPTAPFAEHSGTDFIFAVAVLNGAFQKKVQP